MTNRQKYFTFYTHFPWANKQNIVKKKNLASLFPSSQPIYDIPFNHCVGWTTLAVTSWGKILIIKVICLWASRLHWNENHDWICKVNLNINKSISFIITLNSREDKFMNQLRNKTTMDPVLMFYKFTFWLSFFFFTNTSVMCRNNFFFYLRGALLR